MAQADGSGNLDGDRGALEDCPGEPIFKPIGEISTDITPPHPGENRDINLPPDCGLGDEPFDPRNFALTTYTWKASGMCYKPLYFEDVALERHGHSWGPLLQPVMSGAHFFGTLPILPYKMGVDPPWECVYPLGHYRPGNCAPYMIPPFPISLRGAMVEAGAVVGGVVIIP
jgi:hypothetical protein